jgi:fructose-bisphosphate aldolase, class I
MAFGTKLGRNEWLQLLLYYWSSLDKNWERGGNVSQAEQQEKIRTKSSFIAALDQSGGSTPKALALYGVGPDAWSNDAEMFAVVHEMRTRIITSPSFTGERILGAILFEDTMNRSIENIPTSQYLWEKKNVVPFLKVDKGLEKEQSGVQLMKPMPGLDALLSNAGSKGVFGTKMRSVVKQANRDGIAAIVKQQFEFGLHILSLGLMPIIEPEVDIQCPQKAEAEALLKADILAQLNQLKSGQLVMLKLTLPEKDDFYMDLINHPNVLKVVALSGGYSRAEANARLARNHRMVASFSRALVEGLTKQQSDAEFNAMLDASIESIYQASRT